MTLTFQCSAYHAILPICSNLSDLIVGTGTIVDGSAADMNRAHARIVELEAQIEAMIEQMPSNHTEGSDRVQQLESERDAANTRIAELESQVRSCCCN